MKIVIVGGGSNAWTPNIVKDMLLTPALADAEYMLYDTNLKQAQFIRKVIQQTAKKLAIKVNVAATSNQARAFDGGDYFIITISTGGFDAMAHDLAIPEDFGIYHTVGDTSGPGGWARTLRNFGPFVDLAEAINRYAPGAVVLNYTNPMATLTDVLTRICTGPVVGLCHGLFENLRFLKDYYKLDSEEEIAVEYGGLNHFFWMTKIRARGIDIIADLEGKLKRQSLTNLLAAAHKDVMGFSSKREVATELFRLTGVLPYMGDRHTCEYFPWFITSKQNMRTYKIVRTTIQQRRDGFSARQQRLQTWLTAGIPDDFLQRSRETAADIINAHSQGQVFVDVGNLPNTGQIGNLPGDAVVETAVRIDANGFAPIGLGDLPQAVVGFITPYAELNLQVIDACFAGDRRMALQALRADPVCAQLNGAQVMDLGHRLIKAHKRFIKVF